MPFSPCIGYCSTSIGDEVCRGCFRSRDEVIGWNQYDDNTRFEITRRIGNAIEMASREFFTVQDVSTLLRQADGRDITAHPSAPPAEVAYRLLKKGAGHVRDLTKYGIIPTQSHAGKPPEQIVEMLEARIREAIQRGCARAAQGRP